MTSHRDMPDSNGQEGGERHSNYLLFNLLPTRWRHEGDIWRVSLDEGRIAESCSHETQKIRFAYQLICI